MNWYAGETSTAVIVVNVPHLWPLINRLVGLGSFKSSSAVIDDYSSRNCFTHGEVRTITRSQSKDFDYAGYFRSKTEERLAKAGAWTGNGGTARDDIQMENVEANSIGDAATAEVGRRRTMDEEEGMWPLHNLYRYTVSLGAEGIVKTVYLNPFVE